MEDDAVDCVLVPGSYVLCDKDIIAHLTPEQLLELIQSQSQRLDDYLFSSLNDNKR